MADVSILKRIYLRYARIEAGTDLQAQLTWLLDKFVKRASEADEGGFQATQDSFENATFAGVWKGSSAEDRTWALDEAILELEAKIEAAANGEDKPQPIAAFLPRVMRAPR